MADKRITELNLHTSPQLSDVIAIVNSGETKKTTYGTLYNKIRDGLVSGSSQIILGDTNGFTEFSSSLSASIAAGTNEQDLTNYALISGGNDFIGNQTLTGSLLISGSQTVTGSIYAWNNVEARQGVAAPMFFSSNGSPNLLILTDATQYPGGGFMDIRSQGTDSYMRLQAGNTITIDSPNILTTGSIESRGDVRVTGSLDVSGSLTASLQEGYMWVGDSNNKNTPIPTGSFVQTSQTGSLVESAYISLYSTQSQQLVESGSAQPVTFSNVWTQKGVSLVSGSQIVMNKAGTYQFNFVAQLTNTENEVHDSYFWIKYNGNNFPNSSTQMSLQPRKNESTPSAQLMTVNIVGVAQNDGDYIELYWTGDSDTIQLNETPGDGVKPETPSVIANIVRVG